MINFHVAGVPVPQGSMTPWHVRGLDSCTFGLRHSGGARLESWRAVVATAAKRVMRGRMPIKGPVRVEIWFVFPRPTSHTRAQRDVLYRWGGRRDDIEKLERAVYDALTDAAVWEDDSQVAENANHKLYDDAPFATQGDGAYISILEL